MSEAAQGHRLKELCFTTRVQLALGMQRRKAAGVLIESRQGR